MSGVGDLLAFGLQTDTTSIVIGGTGGARVHADSQLNVTISGTGSVHYQGFPDLDVVITGIGLVVDAN